jgi:hypothetical protein
MTPQEMNGARRRHLHLPVRSHWLLPSPKTLRGRRRPWKGSSRAGTTIVPPTTKHAAKTEPQSITLRNDQASICSPKLKDRGIDVHLARGRTTCLKARVFDPVRAWPDTAYYGPGLARHGP